MSDQIEIRTPTPEDTASDTASLLLLEAIREVQGFTPPRLDEFPSEALIASARAIIAKLDAMETSLLDVLRDLGDSVDFLAARPCGDCACDVPTERESKLIFRALEDDYMDRFSKTGTIGMLAAGELDVDDAIRRFKRMAGLSE